MEFLKKNAKKFLEKAEESFEKGEYNFVMFFVEQFFQLILKFLIAKKFGEFPKTHNFKILFELTEDETLMKFYRENLDLLREIELSYVASRCFDVEYSKNVAERSLNLAKTFLRVIKVD
ncbi:HEPN domain protein [Ferroglobus placidus DSM 10642]|uniref:HEPN domain protein n=1 Tax=Ferroglobus placidus (strain DSM 10642 / AEDII12DO) TaxID=589924 RepID=D3RYL4_FERPA|nr:HEPN domain-containing protein [Ferroglobus placidus]ADC65577.1 HEPN domain protein [Ferroglobus placidus DSM 10642]